MTQNAFAIAIDGPVAAGKGTIARLLAQRLNGFHLNTGAMYRALTWYCLTQQVDLHDEKAVLNALATLSFSLESDVITVNGQDVTGEVKSREVTQAAPIVAAIASVREEMVKRQRAIGLEKMAQGHIVLVDARDAATKIFPDAKLKIFLTASAEERAKRRFAQFGGVGDFSQMVEDIKKRDFQDMHRSATPLVENPQEHDYFVVDTSGLTENDTIAIIMKKIEEIL